MKIKRKAIKELLRRYRYLYHFGDWYGENYDNFLKVKNTITWLKERLRGKK